MAAALYQYQYRYRWRNGTEQQERKDKMLEKKSQVLDRTHQLLHQRCDNNTYICRWRV